MLWHKKQNALHVGRSKGCGVELNTAATLASKRHTEKTNGDVTMAITTKLVKITPSMARMFLGDSNKQNRSVSMSRVAMYANDMKNGDWMTTHQGICFFDDGSLADGQHRLMAITKSDVTVEMMVTSGMPKSSIMGIDTGRPRDAAGVISIAQGDKSFTAKHVAVIKSLFKAGLISGGIAKTNLSPSDLHSIYLDRKEAIDFGVSSIKKNQRGIATAVVKAAAACCYGKIDDSSVNDFFRVLQSGIMLQDKDRTVITLRESILCGRVDATPSGDVRHAIRVICQMIKAYSKGEVMTRTARGTADPFDLSV